jgi:tRNA (guanine-N7-)-methyltransferase
VHPVTIQRGVRSYVLRAGRLTAAQRQALHSYWGGYGLEPVGPLDWRRVYGRAAPRVVEVGFGNGEALLAYAETHPAWDFLGIEVHLPGVGRVLHRLSRQGIGNVRVMRADAVEVFERCIPDASLDAVHIWFPDPWPKKRHHKRRLIQAAFVERLTRCLKPGGRVHLATDWGDYARQMLRVLEGTPGLLNLAGLGEFSTDPGERPVTRFQQRGERLGHSVWDLVFERNPEQGG